MAGGKDGEEFLFGRVQTLGLQLEYGSGFFTVTRSASADQRRDDDGEVETALAFLLLRHTGFRGSDAVRLRFGEIDWDRQEINRLTLKRRKRVVLPIRSELFFALEIERDRRGPDPDPEERVLLNPATGRPLTRP